MTVFEFRTQITKQFYSSLINQKLFKHEQSISFNETRILIETFYPSVLPKHCSQKYRLEPQRGTQTTAFIKQGVDCFQHFAGRQGMDSD